MKKNLLISLSCAVLALFSMGESKAQKTVIHFWHFNNTQPLSGAGGIRIKTPYPADSSMLGHPYVFYTAMPGNKHDTTGLMDNIGTTPADSNTYLAYGSQRTAGNGVRTRNPSDSMQFLWYIPTTGYKNIVINYETQSSSTAHGQQRQVYDYSLDSGKTYITTGLPMAYDSAALVYRKVVVDLSKITTVNNTSKLIFRITYPVKSSPNSTATSGNNRYDNIVIEGDKLTTGIDNEVVSISDYSIYPNPSNDKVYINTPFEGTKNISITNLVGQVMYVSQRQGRQMPVDVAHFNSGIYFVTISDINGENSVTLKFAKN